MLLFWWSINNNKFSTPWNVQCIHVWKSCHESYFWKKGEEIDINTERKDFNISF